MENTTDLKAFNQLFTDYQGRFIRFANTYVRDVAVAEDFTIEALMGKTAIHWKRIRMYQPIFLPS